MPRPRRPKRQNGRALTITSLGVSLPPPFPYEHQTGPRRTPGRELFGTGRLREAVGPLAGYPADVMAARLRSITINFSVEEPRDDIAILVLRNDA